MRRFPAMVLLLAVPCFASAQVVINEIMYAPDAPEPEWVELYNPGPHPVDLDGWTIHDASSARGMFPAVTMRPGGYLVVTRDSARLRAIRPIASPMASVQLPVLNNSGDALILRERGGHAIDSLVYTEEWGGGGGVSLERRNHAYPAVHDSSWGTSADRSGATPGRRNSLSPAMLDLLVESCGFDQRSATVAAVIRNAGTVQSQPATVLLYHDADEDGVAGPAEELLHETVVAMAPGLSATITFRWPRSLTEKGEIALVEVRMQGDERSENNISSVAIRAPLLEAGVVITEIMFDPLPVGTKSGAEYVELYNTNAAPINIVGWKLYDATGKAQATFPARTPVLEPGNRLVVASDSTIFARFPGLRDSVNVVLIGVSSFGLNADGDEVIVRNRNGRVVDSLRNSARWHRRDLGEMKGISLERVSVGGASDDQRNWSSSAAALGGTPGAVNSVEIPPSSSYAVLAVEPRIVSPDGDGHEDFTRISYRLPVGNARIVASVFDRAGRMVRRLASNEPAAAEGELIWDGCDQEMRPLSPGIYVVRLEAYDDGGAGLFVAQGAVIVARRFQD